MRRSFTILAGFAAAIVIGTLIWLFVFVPLSGVLDSPIGGVDKPVRVLLVGLFGAVTVAAIYTFLPATLVVICAETKSLSSCRFYLISGAVIGAASQLAAFLIYPLIFLRQGDTPGHLLAGWVHANLDHPRPLLVAIVAAMIGGVAAGVIYWWMAGCNAGRWRSEEVK